MKCSTRRAGSSCGREIDGAATGNFSFLGIGDEVGFAVRGRFMDILDRCCEGGMFCCVDGWRTRDMEEGTGESLDGIGV